MINHENGQYLIYSLKRAENRNWGYTDIIKEITLMPEATEKEIGEAVIDVLEASEEFYKNYVPKKPNSEIEIELIDDERKLLLIPPKDRHFEDIEDAGAAEIYRCYEYNNDDGEAVAHFYVSIAAELDCDMSCDNIRELWEAADGNADEFTAEEVNVGIFTLRVEMRNKKVHRVSYLLQMDEDLLLDCSMCVTYPNRRKKVDERLSKAFEKFALSCKLKKR